MSEPSKPRKKANYIDNARIDDLISEDNIAKIREEIETYGLEFFGNRVAFTAASENSVEALAFFNKLGISLDLKDTNGLSLHFYACRDRGSVEVIGFLLKNGCRPEPNDLFKAAEKGKIEVLKLYQSHGVDLASCAADKDGMTLLASSIYSNLNCVKFLFSQGLPLEPALLTLATRMGKIDIVQYLVLEQKADPNLLVNGLNSIHHACMGSSSNETSSHLDILKFLHQHGGNLEMKTSFRGEEFTPLHFACYPGPQDKLPVIQYLIDQGIRPEGQVLESAFKVADPKKRKSIQKLFEKGSKTNGKKKAESQLDFDTDKLTQRAEEIIKDFAAKNPTVTIHQFAIEGASIHMHDHLDTEFSVADWAFQNVGEFTKDDGFNMDLWQEHYDNMGQKSVYSTAMATVIKNLKRRKAFENLKLSKKFTATMVDHEY
jgi:ankyrin repeat protein